MLHKLSLGTAQFGSAYGITNKRGQVPRDEAIAIIREALRLGIRTFDTADDYGDAEEIVDEALKGIPNVTVTRKRTATWGRSYWHDGKRFGASIYTREELDRLMDIVRLDIVQLPLNILDQRFLLDGTIDWLQGLGIEVHARSVFLQGALLAEPDELTEPKRSAVLRAQQYVGPPFVKSFLCWALETPVDRVVVGVTSMAELQQIGEAAEGHPWRQTDYSNLACTDESVIDPRNWPKVA